MQQKRSRSGIHEHTRWSCRISASIAVKQAPPKLNNNEGITMIAQSTDLTMPEAFLEYEGVTVYRTYQFDDPSTYPPSSYIFTTSPDGTYSTRSALTSAT
jgi:hypothetical protein